MLTLEQLKNLQKSALQLQEAVDSIINSIQIPVEFLGIQPVQAVPTVQEKPSLPNTPELPFTEIKKEPDKVVTKLPPFKKRWEQVLYYLIQYHEQYKKAPSQRELCSYIAQKENVKKIAEFNRHTRSILAFLKNDKRLIDFTPTGIIYFPDKVPDKFLKEVTLNKSEELTDSEKVLKAATVYIHQANTPVTADQIFAFYKDYFPDKAPHKIKGKESLRGLLSILVSQNKLVYSNDFYDLP